MFAWQATVQDESGNAIPLPVVTVYLDDGTTLASIYDESGAALPNPLTGSMEGFVQFWAPAGNYKVHGASAGMVTETWDVWLGADVTYLNYADALSARKPAEVVKVSAIVRGYLTVWVRDTAGTALGGGWSAADNVTPDHYGVAADGVVDDTANFQLFLNACAGRIGVVNAGRYRINGSLVLPSNSNISGIIPSDTGANGSIMLQYGQKLFDQPENLINLSYTDMMYDLRASDPSAITHVCFSLKSHMGCSFDRYRFVRYDKASIMDRMPGAGALINTIDNTYKDWRVSACTSLDFAVGKEGYYHAEMGDGVKRIFRTGIVWPEQSPGAVTVLREGSQRVCVELASPTDYTVAFEATGALTVNLTDPLAVTQRIHVWPSQPRTDGHRRPISNNLWENIRVDYLFSRGHQSVRWVDAETYRFERLLVSANYARAYVMNPYQSRTGQGGDYAAFEDCIIGKQDAHPDLTLPSSVRAFDLGPGSYCMAARGIRIDQTWRTSSTGSNYSLEYRDGRRIELTGTVSGAMGQNILTGVGSSFLHEVTLVGTNKDLIEVNGRLYAISSIDSATQITLTTNLTSEASGKAYRVNVENGFDGKFEYASMGDGYYSNRAYQGGEVIINNLTERSGSAILPAGETFVVVSHGLRRIPRPGEIFITSHNVTSGRTLSVSGANESTFQINIAPTAPGVDYTIGWHAKLLELN